MKKTLIILSSAIIAFAACKSSSYAKKIENYIVSDEQLTFAKKRWDDATKENLNMGKSIFTNQCTQCHKPFVIESFSEKKWNHEIDDMSPKAKLSAEEKKNLTYFILSYLDSKKTAVN